MRESGFFFFNVPTAENTIVVRQMNYLGKIVRRPTNHPPRQMLTAWSANPRSKGGVLTTNKKALVRSLHTQLPKEMTEMTITKNKTTRESTAKHMLNKDGKLKLWIKITEDEELWNWHLNKLQTPGLSTPLLTQTEQDDPLPHHHPHELNPPCNNQIHQGTRTIKEENVHNKEISPPPLLHPQCLKPLKRVTTKETGTLKA
jgi:hypothetical protein